eukprot:jgi/Pico_ML_1/51182/g2260.t1
MTFFFGCVGLFNLTFFLPVVLVYSLYHPEFFYITSSDFGLCLIKVLTFLGGALVLGGFFGLQREELVDEAYL